MTSGRFPGAHVLAVGEQVPTIAEDVFIAPGAVVVGDVEIGAGSSVWFNAVIRGDVAPIRIGAGTNIQDGAVLHVDRDAPCVLGDRITVGHGAIVHGTTIEDEATVGMGAIVLSRSRVGRGALVAAGAVVPEDAVVSPGALAAGVPAVEKRQIGEALQARLTRGADSYIENGSRYRRELRPLDGDTER